MAGSSATTGLLAEEEGGVAFKGCDTGGGGVVFGEGVTSFCGVEGLTGETALGGSGLVKGCSTGLVSTGFCSTTGATGFMGSTLASTLGSDLASTLGSGLASGLTSGFTIGGSGFGTSAGCGTSTGLGGSGLASTFAGSTTGLTSSLGGSDAGLGGATAGDGSTVLGGSGVVDGFLTGLQYQNK